MRRRERNGRVTRKDEVWIQNREGEGENTEKEKIRQGGSRQKSKGEKREEEK